MEPWYAAEGLHFAWSSSNPDVLSVDENGVVTTHKKGVASVTVSAVGYSRVSATVRINVVSEFRILNYTLYEYHGSPDAVIPDELNIMFLDKDTFAGNTEIRSIKFPSTLTEIPEEALKNCTALETVILPSELTVVGKSAFEGCVSLKTLVLEKFIDDDHKVGDVADEMTGALTLANRAFAGCVSLSEIVNSLRLTTVGREAFAGCTNLRTLDIRGVAVAYESAFSNCTSLEKVVMSPSTQPSAYMFRNCTSLQHVYTASLAQESVFDGDGNVTAGVTQGYPMRAVSAGMFEGCVALDEVTFAGDLMTVGDYAFARTGLQTVAFDGSVRLGSFAFANCPELRELALGERAYLTFAGEQTFGGSENFTTITVAGGNNNYSVSGNATDGCVLYNKDGTEIILLSEKITSVSLSGVASVGNGVFAGKKTLASVDLRGVSRIGDYAFADTGLTSVTLPASLQYLGKGAFKGCDKLAQVDGLSALADITVLSDEAFADCTSLTSVALPSGLTEIGNDAFRGCTALTQAVFGGNETSIGSGAFEGDVRLSSLTLPATVRRIGDKAFAGMRALTEFAFPAVTEMGESVLGGCINIRAITFADGAETVGDYLMVGDNISEAKALTSVTLPNSVTHIGEGAFFGCDKLTTVDLTHAQTIGALAFFGTSLTAQGTREIGATKIGEMAFANISTLQGVSLPNATDVGSMAFAESSLTNVQMQSVKKLGANAFSGTKLSAVELPASLDSYSMELPLMVFKRSANALEEQIIRTESVGAGAFAAIDTLTSVTVANGNPVFFTDDGVLYARVANGYTLVQYPTAKTGESYEVLARTVRIEPDAFHSVKHLKSVTLPAELRSVGSRAFFQSSVKDYTFKSVQAPTLDSEFVSVANLPSDDLMYKIFATESNLQLGSQIFYANFYDYVAKITEERNLNESGNRYTAVPFGLHITYPENGTGYDNMIWSAFFDERTHSAYAPDATTIATVNALAALPTAAQIAAVGSFEELEELHATYVATARALYNSIGDAKQLAFVENYDDLLRAEAAVRAARASFGKPAVVTELKILSAPAKLRYYAGDTFDPTGLRVVAVYSDTSEEEITNYALDKTTLALGDNAVTVSYLGVTQTIDISVSTYVEYTVTFAGKGVRTRTEKVASGATVQEPNAPTRKGYAFAGWYNGDTLYDFSAAVTADITLTARWNKTGGSLSGGSIAGIVIAAVVVAGGAAFAVWWFVFRKRGDKANAAAQTSGSDARENAGNSAGADEAQADEAQKESNTDETEANKEEESANGNEELQGDRNEKE